VSTPSWLLGGVLLAHMVSIANQLGDGNRNTNTAYKVRTSFRSELRGLIRSLLNVDAVYLQAGAVLNDHI
jgi:hypothetical protein